MTPVQTLSPLAQDLCRIVHEAGEIILRHYAGDIESRTKSDSSPVTQADEEAEARIVRELARLDSRVPIVAEEAAAAGQVPETGRRFFLVDPLDGTKEFIQRNGEFTVNIALIEDGMPVCGVVSAPALSRMFVGDLTGPAPIAAEISAPTGVPLNLSRAKPIHARTPSAGGLIAVASRSHRDQKTEDYLAQYSIADLVAAGSSLKFCLVAAGEADIYPRLGRTMEWDVAAGHAVLSAAGGTVTQIDGSPFFYGKTAQGFANPYFVARGRP